MYVGGHKARQSAADMLSEQAVGQARNNRLLIFTHTCLTAFRPYLCCIAGIIWLGEEDQITERCRGLTITIPTAALIFD